MPPLLRVAHLADIHIGMENYGRINPETGWNQRLHDFLDTLDFAIAEALQAGVDLFVIAGDIYKTRDPTPTQQREFALRIRRISETGIPVFIVAGNHDIPLSLGRATSVDVFGALEVPNVTVARRIGAYRLETPRGPAQILAFPWSVRSLLLAQAEFKNLTITESNEAMVRLARERLAEVGATLDPTLPTMVVGHAHISGAQVGAERLLMMGSDPLYDVRAFDVPTVDYVAMGHLHRHQVVNALAPAIVYSGSINRVDFGEEREDKGWVLVEIAEKGRAEWQFHPVPARAFLTIDARPTTANPTEEVVLAIARHGDRIREAVVRLRLDISHEHLGALREDEIRGQLKGAYFVAIERNVLRSARERWVVDHSHIQQASPIDALQYYLEQRRVEPQRVGVLLKYAHQLMAGPAAAVEAPAELAVNDRSQQVQP